MGKECTMLEVLKVPMEKEEEEEEFEMSLELSIGGSYAKSKNPKKLEENIQRSDFSCENGCNSMDLHKRKEIQALRRQEARKKREEKLKKSKGANNLGFLEDDKLFLEAKKFQVRVEDREIREKDGFSGEFPRKKDGFSREFSAKREKNDLSLSLSTAENNNKKMQMQCLYPQVQYGFAYPCSWIKPNVAYHSGNSSMEYDSEQSNNGNLKMVSNNGSLEQSSSAISDYQSTSQKGGSNSDTGSHSSPLRPRQFHSVPRKSPLEQPEGNDSSSQTIPGHVLGGVPQTRQIVASLSIPPPAPGKSNPSPNQTDNTPDSKPENRPPSPSKETSSGPIEKPPKPPNNNLNAASISRMPSVTTTGNGPNGKTITGILYEYTKAEVSIMCVCHGSSFSPAGFVEHAGGVDISHPLRHITIVPPR